MPVIFMYSPPSIHAFVLERDRLLGSCSLALWQPRYSFLPGGVASSRKDQHTGPGPSRGVDSRSVAGWICVPNLSPLEISSRVLLCPEVASVPVSGPVHPLLAAAEHLEALLPSSLAGQLLEGGGSSAGAGVFPPWVPLGVPL